MATIGEPRYNLSAGLTGTSQDNYTRTFSYLNMRIGSASSGYVADDIVEFAEAVASLTGGTLNTLNINAQYPVNS